MPPKPEDYTGFRVPLLTETGQWRRAELLTVPEWRDRTVEVRCMSAGERINFLALTQLQALESGNVATDWGAVLPASVIPCVWSPAYSERGDWLPGESTRRVFRWADWDAVSALPAPGLQRVHSRVMVLSGFEKADLSDSYMRLTSDGEFRLLFELAYEWGCTLTELAERMPAWELSWWRSYLTLRAWETKQASRSSGGGRSEMSGFGAAS